MGNKLVCVNNGRKFLEALKIHMGAHTMSNLNVLANLREYDMIALSGEFSVIVNKTLKFKRRRSS
jgi:hypothetical protein